MTLHQMTELMNAAHNGTFGTNYAGYYDISNTEAERIASRAEDVEDFEMIWAGQSWWIDANFAE